MPSLPALGVLSRARRLARRVGQRVVERVAGPGGSFTTRLLVGVVVLLGMVSGVGIFYALTANVDTSGSSTGFLTTVLDWGTNGWGYVFMALLMGRSSLWGFRKSLIRLSARKTGYSAATIDRLATEARTTDGCTRILASASDDLGDLAETIRWGFAGRHERIEHDADHDAPRRVETVSWWSDALSREWPDDGETRDPSIGERFAVFRKDIAAAFDTGDVLWRFIVPALVVFVLELVVVRFWVSIWLYPVLLSTALFLAGAWYVAGKWYRHRKLDSLRADDTEDAWGDVAVLVKSIDTQERTVYVGFLEGRRYASDDPEQLAQVLAERALQRARGETPSPAIEERYAWCLRRYLPLFESWRENVEKPAVMDELVETVRGAPDGLIDKHRLADAVVTADRACGYDPELVAEAYRELVPEALVEESVAVPTADGETATRTVVRLRTEPLPKDAEQLRASFSDRFHDHDEYDYRLPDVDVGEDADPFVLPTDAPRV